MKRLKVSIAALVSVALAGVLVNSQPNPAAQPACLHGANEAPEQVARRQRALSLTRLINSLQNDALGQTRAYQALDKLLASAWNPEGFTVHLVTDGASYAFSVKDTVDPCAFGYFSDERGVIFVGQAIR